MENIFHDGPHQADAAFGVDVLQFLYPLFLAPFDLRIVRQHDEVDVLLVLVDGGDADEVGLLRIFPVRTDEQDVERLSGLVWTKSLLPVGAVSGPSGCVSGLVK